MSTWSSRAQRRTPARRKKRSINIRRPRLTKASGAWGAFTALFGLLAVTVQSVMLIVLAVVSLLGLIVTAFAGDRVAVQTRRAATEKRTSAGRKPVARRSPTSGGTTTRKRPKCSARCQRSVRPASTCDCVCAGRTHGAARAGGAKVTRDELKAKPARRAERQMRKAP